VLTYFASGHAITNFRFLFRFPAHKSMGAGESGKAGEVRATNEDVSDEMNVDSAENTHRHTVGTG
jgi:hypothetical protein